MSTDRVQWRIQTDEGISNWTDYTGPIVLDSRDTHPKLMLRVIPLTVAGAEPSALSQHTVENVCDGATGEPGASITGPQGPVVRIRGLFTEGDYYDGTEAVYEKGVPVYWLDIVWVEDTSGNRYYKRCVDSGYYDSSNGPHPSDNETSRGWADFSQLDNLIVDLLIAKNANIQFLNGQQIVFGETLANGTTKLWGRIGVPTKKTADQVVEGIIMWLGGESLGKSTMSIHKNGTTTFGSYGSGRRIVLNPEEKSMNVYDNSGRLAVIVDGDTHNIDDLYQVNDALVKTWEGATYSATTSRNLGTLTTGVNGHIRLKTTVYMQAQAAYNPDYPPGDHTLRGSVDVTLTVYKDGAAYRKESVSYTNNAIWSIPPATGETKDGSSTQTLELDTDLPPGSYTVRLDVTVSKPNYMGTTASASATLSGYTGVFTEQSDPRALLCANGLIAADSARNFLTAGVKSSEGFVIEASVGDKGMRVSSEGMISKDRNGAWNAVLMTCEKQAADANLCVLEQLGSRMFTTDANTANLPSGAGTYYGAIMTTTLNVTAGHHIQEWKSFSQPVQCYTRRCMNNTWGAWTRNY